VEQKQHYFESRIVYFDEDKVLTLVRNVTARKRAEKRLSRITECFLEFEPDPLENIRKLTRLCGELLHASHTSYVMCQGDEFLPFTRWCSQARNIFPEVLTDITTPLVLKKKEENITEITNVDDLCKDRLGTKKPAAGAKTYLGKKVQRGEKTVGILNAFFKNQYKPDEEAEKIMGILAIAIAIEEGRAHYRNRLEEEKERLLVTMYSITDGVVATDTTGKIILLNEVASRLVGWRQEKATGKDIKQVMSLFDEREERTRRDLVETIIKKGKPYDFPHEFILEKEDKTWRLVSLSGAPIRNKEDRIIGLVFVLRDITEQKVIEEEMIRKQKLESIGTLAAGIAHDFNNLLTGMFGSLEMARKFVDSREKVLHYISNALSVYERAKNLTMQLLTFSKGGQPIKKLHFLQEILENTARFALSGTNISYELRLADNLWMCRIDKNQVEQAIDNILINARQAMPDGGTIMIDAENVVPGEHAYSFLHSDTPYVKIQIEDEGIGISKKDQSKIFDPFFTTKEKGSGLGLATAYSIIQQHDGHIILHSQPGKGSQFAIFLPANPSVQPQTPDISEIKLHQGKGRILVMDDDDMILNVASHMLRDLGYEVNTCKDGQEALEIYEKALQKREPFDALILDLTVPGRMGGKKMVEILRERYPDAITIATSGYSSDPVMMYPQKYGFDDNLPKPYQYKQLQNVLQRLLTNKTQ